MTHGGGLPKCVPGSAERCARFAVDVRLSVSVFSSGWGTDQTVLVRGNTVSVVGSYGTAVQFLSTARTWQLLPPVPRLMFSTHACTHNANAHSVVCWWLPFRRQAPGGPPLREQHDRSSLMTHGGGLPKCVPGSAECRARFAVEVRCPFGCRFIPLRRHFLLFYFEYVAGQGRTQGFCIRLVRCSCGCVGQGVWSKPNAAETREAHHRQFLYTARTMQLLGA